MRGCLRLLRTIGCSSKLSSTDYWRDLPERFGRWKAVHQRFSRWAKSGVFDRIFKLLAEDHDNEYMMIDATIVRAHQHSAGARKQAIGRSRGGPSTKIHALADALGNPCVLMLLGRITILLALNHCSNMPTRVRSLPIRRMTPMRSSTSSWTTNWRRFVPRPKAMRRHAEINGAVFGGFTSASQAIGG